MSSSPMPWIIPQFFTNDGEMADGYQLFSYVVNSLTKQDTYTASDLITANSNPLILDQYGRAPIFLALQNYRFILAPPTDTDPPVNPVWDMDYVPAYATGAQNFDISGVAGEDTDANHNVVYLSDGNDGKTPGLWYLVNALVPASSTRAITIGVAQAPILLGQTGTIRLVGKSTGFTSFSLTPGATYYASDVSNGEVTGTPPTNAIIVGKADTVSSLILEPNWGAASSTVRGMIRVEAQSLGGIKTFLVQPRTYGGASTTLPLSPAGRYFTDVVTHAVPQNQSNSVMSSTTIPANMLDSDGKSVEIRFGSAVAGAGAGTQDIFIKIDGVSRTLLASGTVEWVCKCLVVRTSSSTAQIATLRGNPGLGVSAATFAQAGLDFTAAITVESLATTGAGTNVNQTFFTVAALG